MSGTTHLHLQNPLFRKYTGLCSKLIWRKGYHHWFIPALGRWSKSKEIIDMSGVPIERKFKAK
jgi:hypothetical protein